MERSLVLLSLSLLSACAHKRPEKGEPVAAFAARRPAAAETPRLASAPPGCRQDLDCGDRQLCIRDQCVDISADLAECKQVRVAFPFNSAELPADVSTTLARSARCLKADRALHVTIEGHADERGTEEYNLALGDRRASAIARHLERLGVVGAQLSTVSYGEENPLCSEHDEACWIKNRRAELTPGRDSRPSQRRHQ